MQTEMLSTVHGVRAETHALEGTIEGELDGDGLPDFSQPHLALLELPADAIKSGNPLQDVEMNRRMEVRTYPLINVRANRAWWGDEAGRCRADVEVTVHGRTASFEEDFTLRVNGQRLEVEGQHLFDMREFDVSTPDFLGLRVDPQVSATVHIVAEQESPGT